MQMLFWRKNFDDGKCPGLPQPRTYNFYYYLELLVISNVKQIEKYRDFEPWSGTKGKGKLITLRFLKSKKSTRNRNCKSKRTRSACVQTLDTL
jgi:hypothetical protein